jgi:hypothetical protein
VVKSINASRFARPGGIADAIGPSDRRLIEDERLALQFCRCA